MGTVLCFSGATSSAQPKRSSSQSRTITNPLISALPLSGDDDLFAAHMDVVLLERTGRRTRDVASGEVINAVVAGTPNLLNVVAVLHGATQVSAGGRHGFVFALGTHNQEPGPGAPIEYLGRVGLQVTDLGGDDGVATHIDRGGRDQVAHDGIKERSCGGEETAPEQHLDESPPPGLLQRRREDGFDSRR